MEWYCTNKQKVVPGKFVCHTWGTEYIGSQLGGSHLTQLDNNVLKKLMEITSGILYVREREGGGEQGGREKERENSSVFPMAVQQPTIAKSQLMTTLYHTRLPDFYLTGCTHTYKQYMYMYLLRSAEIFDQQLPNWGILSRMVLRVHYGRVEVVTGLVEVA